MGWTIGRVLLIFGRNGRYLYSFDIPAWNDFICSPAGRYYGNTSSHSEDTRVQQECIFIWSVVCEYLSQP